MENALNKTNITDPGVLSMARRIAFQAPSLSDLTPAQRQEIAKAKAPNAGTIYEDLSTRFPGRTGIKKA